jgi:CubicO group peptidase (beta-lactamase class C family)
MVTDLSLSSQVACLQLVDQGLVSLDNPADVTKYLPELAEFQILNGYDNAGKAILEDQMPKGAITLRMLLSHTSGMSFCMLRGLNLSRWRQVCRIRGEVSSRNG